MPKFLWKWGFYTWDFNKMNPQKPSQNCINVLNYPLVCFFFFKLRTSLGIILAAALVSASKLSLKSVQNNRKVPLKWQCKDMVPAVWTEAQKPVMLCYVIIYLSCRWQRRCHFERSESKAYIAALPVWLQWPATLKSWFLLSPEYIL